MNKPFGIILTSLTVAICWHLILWGEIPAVANVQINPITDVATVALPGASTLGFTDPSAIAAFDAARDFVGSPIGERKLNSSARQYLDVYAMILQYHVIIIDQKPPLSSPSSKSAASPSPSMPSSSTMALYRDDRFGFSVTYPKSFSENKTRDDEDTVYFTSPNSGITISVSGSNSNGASVGEIYDEVRKKIEVTPVDERVGTKGFLVSWRASGEVRFMSMYVGSGSVNTLTIQYPEDQYDQCDAIAQAVLNGFRPGETDQSW